MNSRLEKAIQALSAMDIEDAEDPRETLALAQRDILREYSPAYMRWLDAHPEAEEGLFPVEEESAEEQRRRMAGLRPEAGEDIRRWLRFLRYRELIRVAVSDFSGLDDFDTTTASRPMSEAAASDDFTAGLSSRILRILFGDSSVVSGRRLGTPPVRHRPWPPLRPMCSTLKPSLPFWRDGVSRRGGEPSVGSREGRGASASGRRMRA